MSSSTSPTQPNPIKNVALVGANGSLGSVILRALIESNRFHVSILRRLSSTSSLPPDLEANPALSILTVSDAWEEDELADALKGQDAVIAAFPVHNVEEHIALANAAYKSETVRRFIPADFGSVDARSPLARSLVPLFERKVVTRKRLEDLAARSVSDGNRQEFSWTSLVNGHFFDWGLANGFLHFYPGEKRAEILGSGNERSSTATLGKVAEAVIRILRDRLEESRNRVLMVQSFCVSQLDVLASVERVTGQKWKVGYEDTERFIARHKALADGGDKESIEDLVFALGVVDGNWETKEDIAMGLLGLEEEDLDTEVRKALGRN
ncbi:hypothetical protein V8F06_006670 [Rhypophila decipiens]